MKFFQNISVFIIMAIIFASCQKVINVQLNDAAKKYVIEANITNVPGQCAVIITQTKNFSDNNNFPGIDGAVVNITDNAGQAIPLSETTQGNYTTQAINGTPGHLYTLSVVIGVELFTASSIMPSPVNLDSITVKNQMVFGDSTRTVNVHYIDPIAKGNAYHFIQYKNGVQEKTVFATNDDFTNGNILSTQLMSYDNSTDDDKLRSGDSLKVVMECIDASVYLYWFSIVAASGNSDSATPANPVSNITGGALGYFSAHTTQSKTIAAP
jgi:Domain of unknown function (DUF4249)